MTEIALQVAYRVDIIECERGWGQRLEETKYFDNEKEARTFQRDFNSRNPPGLAPDWYMRAEYHGKVE